MNAMLQTPTADTVRTACERFDRENELIEQTLSELFQQYPRNDDLRHVLLKVVAVNALYHTCIYALDTVARHIYAHGAEIDAALAAGSHEIVDKIAKVRVQGKVHNFFSFATKYCSWHQPEKYPIYDSRVDSYLWNLQQQSAFAAAFQVPGGYDDNGKANLQKNKQFKNFLMLDTLSFGSSVASLVIYFAMPVIQKITFVQGLVQPGVMLLGVTSLTFMLFAFSAGVAAVLDEKSILYSLTNNTTAYSLYLPVSLIGIPSFIFLIPQIYIRNKLRPFRS